MCKFIGIDISKQVFDVSFLENSDWKHVVLENGKVGFKKLLKLIGKEDLVVMEASGSYYLPLADFLFNMDIKVVVENPLIIKRYSQSKLKRAKTDKADSKIIAEYAQKNAEDLRLWVPDSEVVSKMRQYFTRVQLLQKQVNQSNNQLEAFTSSGLLDKTLENEMINSVKNLKKSIEKLELLIEKLAKSSYAKSIECLTSIPGIGLKSAVMLIAATNNFEKFENYKQLIAFVGFSPRIYQSGSSVRGKGSICKMGKSQIRKLLYMCSWSAKRWNKSCKDMYERLIAKGKPERVVKIAIANKLLKLAFAIGKKQEKYEVNYC
ncbi:IS110 family RNA-guided transposase [Frigoriflavimonas asaccharolytica]|uniref:Transposase n=1 Tax=Frigoriflavimonas asaccharolytica TaxID=2735899 RepID=A0A8J8G6B3_9FLAO|nr:IS110 family transposase [Frigoriflavimonas asaccharolytica]NRS92051.1 transposase [Frigoriflavimonas asaccharolytica]